MPRKLYMGTFMLIVGIILLDQISKIAVRSFMTEGQSISVIKGFFSITYIENRGVAFGLLSKHGWVVIALQLAVVIVVLILFLKMRGKSRLFDFALAIILAGGIGNIIDRLIKGSVTDMLSFSIFPPVFNVADIGVTVGCALIILDLILDISREKKNREI